MKLTSNPHLHSPICSSSCLSGNLTQSSLYLYSPIQLKFLNRLPFSQGKPCWSGRQYFPPPSWTCHTGLTMVFAPTLPHTKLESAIPFLLTWLCPAHPFALSSRFPSSLTLALTSLTCSASFLYALTAIRICPIQHYHTSQLFVIILLLTFQFLDLFTPTDFLL